MPKAKAKMKFIVFVDGKRKGKRLKGIKYNAKPMRLKKTTGYAI